MLRWLASRVNALWRKANILYQNSLQSAHTPLLYAVGKTRNKTYSILERAYNQSERGQFKVSQRQQRSE